jgi:hypothetical protein
MAQFLCSFPVLFLCGLSCHHLRAEAPATRHELPSYVPGPPGGVWDALDSFYAFRSALSRADFATAASFCVEETLPEVSPRSENLKRLLPAEIREPSTKVVVLSIDSTYGHMRLGIGVLGEPARQQFVFQLRKIEKQWRLVWPLNP